MSSLARLFVLALVTLPLAAGSVLTGCAADEATDDEGGAFTEDEST